VEHLNKHTISIHTVPRETFRKTDELIGNFRGPLEAYLDRLLWWNERVNLVSRNVPRETIWEHIRHSLLLSQFEPFQSAKLIIDAGTGGGLPGLPLAITRPEKHFVLNDLVTKKCLAMKQMAKKLSLDNIGIVDGSIEKLQQNQPFVMVSKHAFKINELYQMTSSLPWTSTALYKGIDFKNELAGIPESLTIEAYDLSDESDFYKGKALVFIDRD